MGPPTQTGAYAIMQHDKLEERIARLEDMRAIQALKYRYAACCDSGYSANGFRAIFAPDARWAAEGFGDFSGLDEICGFFTSLSESVVEVLHYVTSPQIVLAADGQSATGQFYLLCLSRSVNRQDASVIDTIATLGTYDDRFVKIKGDWRIREMIVNIKRVGRLPIDGMA